MNNLVRALALIVCCGGVLALSNNAIPLTKVTKSYSRPADAEVKQFADQVTWSFDFPKISVKKATPAEKSRLEAINALIIKDAGVMPPSDGYSTTDVAYDIKQNSNQLLSILFNTSTYGLGAAHPNGTLEVFHYDLSTGKKLKLKDFFTSTKAIKSYINQNKPDCYYNGSEPLEISPQAYFTTIGLTLVYSPYEICAYAAGPVEVVVPKSVLLPIASNITKTRVWK